MVEFPTTQLGFEQAFSTEEACIDYLIQLRWPEGVKCPHCQSEKLWRSGHLLQCSVCGRQTRVMAGTIFQDTHLPLMIWYRAIWMIMNQKYGANAMDLMRLLGISHKTAWNLLHKLRRAMVRPDRDKLYGVVEVDETYIGGSEEGVHGRQIVHKDIAAIAVEVRGQKLGRIRMRLVETAGSDALIPFIKNNIEPGSQVITDGLASYSNLQSLGLEHIIKTSSSNKKALPNVHLIISLLKRWILGTFQGSISKKQFDYYLDEFVFRFNRRTSSNRVKLFQRLMEEAVITSPVTRFNIKDI
ncbi:MAG: IS1595 family transposase [Deltaproteobacteria bacterium]|nr:IS1595 family transposase [Deltaproteobacteria bacterium]